MCLSERMTQFVFLLLCRCRLKVMPKFSVIPSILVVLTRTGELLSVIRLTAYSKLYGVIIVNEDLLVETFILLLASRFSSVDIFL